MWVAKCKVETVRRDRARQRVAISHLLACQSRRQVGAAAGDHRGASPHDVLADHHFNPAVRAMHPLHLGVANDDCASALRFALQRFDELCPAAIEVAHTLRRQLQLHDGGTGIEKIRGMGIGAQSYEHLHEPLHIVGFIAQPLADWYADELLRLDARQPCEQRRHAHSTPPT